MSRYLSGALLAGLAFGVLISFVSGAPPGPMILATVILTVSLAPALGHAVHAKKASPAVLHFPAYVAAVLAGVVGLLGLAVVGTGAPFEVGWLAGIVAFVLLAGIAAFCLNRGRTSGFFNGRHEAIPI